MEKINRELCNTTENQMKTLTEELVMKNNNLEISEKIQELVLNAIEENTGDITLFDYFILKNENKLPKHAYCYSKVEKQNKKMVSEIEAVIRYAKRYYREHCSINFDENKEHRAFQSLLDKVNHYTFKDIKNSIEMFKSQNYHEDLEGLVFKRSGTLGEQKIIVDISMFLNEATNARSTVVMNDTEFVLHFYL